MINKFLDLMKFTQARIGIEKTGNSLATKEQLKLKISLSEAKYAIYKKWELEEFHKNISQSEVESIILKSKIDTKEQFLMRPDLGQILHIESEKNLRVLSIKKNFDIVFCISDGLSGLAITNHFNNFWNIFYPQFKKLHDNPPIFALVPYGRVAVSDHVGEILSAKISVIFIGERPGLSAFDSMGIYLTYNPKVGNANSARNCISNIRPPYGLGYEEASNNLLYLIQESLKLGYSGVDLKLASTPQKLKS